MVEMEKSLKPIIDKFAKKHKLALVDLTLSKVVINPFTKTQQVALKAEIIFVNNENGCYK